METTQNPQSEFDYAAAAADIVRYVRQQWPDAGVWRRAEALIVAAFSAPLVVEHPALEPTPNQIDPAYYRSNARCSRSTPSASCGMVLV